jgi:hypothetical protein
MKNVPTMLMVTACGIASMAMSANAAPVSHWVCKNNSGSKVRFVDDPSTCGNGETALQLNFDADEISVRNDTDYYLRSFSSSYIYNLYCRPLTQEVTAIRIPEEQSRRYCISSGSFLISTTIGPGSIGGECRDINNSSFAPDLDVVCRLDAKIK